MKPISNVPMKVLGGFCVLSFLAVAGLFVHRVTAGPPSCVPLPHDGAIHECGPVCAGEPVVGPPLCGPAGAWYWLRSPDEEKRVVASLYNRYCIRCHGADGRGVWDIPDVPNFTNAQWQACRSDGQLARIIIEGRGAVMPPFRGAMTLEEAWAMARYLRTFLPGTEATRPDLGSEETSRSKTGSSKKEK